MSARKVLDKNPYKWNTNIIRLLRVVISSYNEDSDYSFGQKSAKIKHQSLFRCIFVSFLKIFVFYPALYLFLGTFHHTELDYSSVLIRAIRAKQS